MSTMAFKEQEVYAIFRSLEVLVKGNSRKSHEGVTGF